MAYECTECGYCPLPPRNCAKCGADACMVRMPSPAEDRLKRITEALAEIVESDGEDAGLILLSWDSPTRYDPDLKCQVYLHENFSPLGDALVKLAKLARGE